MDNLTHSLAGLAAGELLQQTLAREPDAASHSSRRRMLLVACWAANNFPDLDLLLRGRLPKPLDYLLDHRGHTHTLLYALPQALLIAALVWLLWPGARGLLRVSAAARTGLAWAIGLGLCMHLGMDFLNSYGMHPFYPFDARWFYGDTLFIVEPVLWIAFGAPLAMMLPRRWVRIAVAALMAAVFGLSLSRGLLAWGSVLGLGAAGVGLAWRQRRSGAASRQGLMAGVVLALAFVSLECWLSAQAKRVIAADLLRQDPAMRVLDIAMTPLPGNPLCWSFASVARASAGPVYELRRGMYSAAPTLMPVAACPAGLSTPGQAATAQLGYAWTGRFALAKLRALALTCRGNAWLRFARMPAIGEHEASDARFGAPAGQNFTTIDTDGIALLPCPGGVPQWGFPRADLLNGG